MKPSALGVEARADGDVLRVVLGGAFEAADLRDADAAARALPRPLAAKVAITLAPGRLGARGAAVLERFCAALEAEGARVALSPADDAQRRILEGHVARPEGAPKRAVGRAAASGRDAAVRALLLLRDMLAVGLFGFLRPGRSRFGAWCAAVLDVGVRALPLTILINFLLGAVLALNAGPFFARYGQEILVAQLVAMAQLREIGPLLTAILVAGRTASSLAAEIGAMKAAEELDALEVMGTSPVDALVAPRWRALAVALPVLTIAADVAGVFGGFVVGVTALDLSGEAWIDQTLKASRLRDVVGGLVKSVAFATTLVAVAAHQGFSTEGGAAGTGRRTTRAVVLGILGVVVVDAFFTLVLYGMDL